MRFRTLLKIIFFPVYIPIRAGGCGGFYNHYIARQNLKTKVMKGVI